MDRTDSAGAEEGSPVMLEVLVEDAVSDVVRQEILYLHRGPQAKRDARVDPEGRQSERRAL